MRRFFIPAAFVLLGCAGVLGDSGSDPFGLGGDSGEPAPVDADGDGFPEAEDCDDQDGSVNPDAEEVQGNGVDDDCDAGTCVRTGFQDEPDELSLPGDYGARGTTPFYSIANSDNCDAEYDRPESVLTDLTGDGTPDLVLTTVCGEADVGDTRWVVHAGGRDSFADEAADWALPAAYGHSGTTPFYSLYNSDNCDAAYERPESAIADMDGDGSADLVITESCDDTAVGDTQWLVHLAAGSGFAEEATVWALPAAYGEAGTTPFYSFANTDNCDSSYERPESALTDLDGDGLPDLVITESCDDTKVGDTKWLVHKNTGGGFEETAVEWALPARYGQAGTLPFYALASSDNCDTAYDRPESVLADLDGNGRIDLLILQSCDDDAVGDTEWWVHANVGEGFAEEPTTWGLPKSYGKAGTQPFYSLANSDNCDAAYDRPESAVNDLDGDGAQDLVILLVCDDDSVGDTRWLVHDGGDDGFAAEARAWSLPATYGEKGTQPFYSMANSDNCDAEIDRPESYTVDADGNDAPDLLLTQVCDDDSVGDTVWRLHRSFCDE